MRYETIKSGIFRERPNRFTACVETEGSRETVHVKNTGRCRELLIPGVKVYLSQAGNRKNRKTNWDLVCVEKRRPGRKPLLINMDSQIPNDAAEEWLKKGELFGKTARIRREVTYVGSRFDFRIDDEKGKCHYLEVKGVTLEEDGVALFPDAPTERGVRHLKELAACAKAGFGAWILFVIQIKGMRVFRPNRAMHEDFARALIEARKSGVKILARECEVTPNSLEVAGPVPVELAAEKHFHINRTNQQQTPSNTRRNTQNVRHPESHERRDPPSRQKRNQSSHGPASGSRLRTEETDSGT